jgi:hypothetical protein
MTFQKEQDKAALFEVLDEHEDIGRTVYVRTRTRVLRCMRNLNRNIYDTLSFVFPLYMGP